MRTLFYSFFVLLILASCSNQTNQSQQASSDNPFFTVWDTPFGVPPFDKIKESHFMPAFQEGIKRQLQEIDSIVNNHDAPSFSNTIEAFEYSGKLLADINGVFNNIAESNTNDSLQKIAKEVAPLIARQDDNIYLNAGLYKRVKTVYDRRDSLKLNPEQYRLVEETHKRFIRGGAALDANQQKRMREINEELSTLSLQFGDNLLAETNAFQLVLDKKEDLAGLPQGVIDAAADAAKEAKLTGKWVFGLQSPSIWPFLQYSEKRDLREKILTAYINRGNNNNKNDNKEIIKKIINLKLEKAKLLGYKNFAEFVLEKNMSKTPENVIKFLNKLWAPAIKVAIKEAKELQTMIDKEGGNFKLEPWDWRFYAEKLRKQKYDLNDEELRPYFELENVKKGMFEVANKLYGLQFKEITDVPKYHPDAVVYEVKDGDGSLLGILYMDFYPRASKRGGAWMDNFRGQYMKDGKDTRPVVTTVFNFTQPTGNTPALLNWDEVTTMYHEFGHALHGLLSKCTYPSLSGSSVARDFVECPSQIMENWPGEPEVLKMYAKNYKTGEIIPENLVKKLEKSALFNQGFATIEYLAASLLDMKYHMITEPFSGDILAFEDKTLKEMGLIPEIIVRYRSTYFNHIFGGGYSAGYYSYIWSEVLDADAFELFRQNGIFDQKTAKSFRDNVLSKGNTDDPMKLYKNFRGAEPDITPLLKRRGLQ